MPTSLRSSGSASPMASHVDPAESSLAAATFSESGRRMSWPEQEDDAVEATSIGDVNTDTAIVVEVPEVAPAAHFESFEAEVSESQVPLPAALALDHDNPQQWARQWPEMAPYVTPFESDRRDYANPSKYPGGAAIELHPRLVMRMLDACAGSKRRVATNLTKGLGLEFAGPIEGASESGVWSRGSTSPVLGQSPGMAGSFTDADDEDTPTAVIVRLAGAHDNSPGALGTNLGGGLPPTTFTVGRVGGLAARTGRSGRGSPHPGALGRPGSALRDPSLSSVAGALSKRFGGGGDVDTQSQTTSASAPPRVLFEDEGSPIDRIRELEAEVRELSRMLRVVQHDRQRGSQTNSPTNTQQIIVSCRPSTVAAAVPTTVRVTVSALEADFAPYSIKVGRSIVPCIVSDRRTLSFVTPTLPPGSTPLQVMCTTAEGSVRRYGRAVWIESKPQRGMSLTAQAIAAAAVSEPGAGEGRLTRHAVNQLAPDVPLPSGSTLRDPSETGRTSVIESTVGKSEYDETSDTESNTALSEARVPLTREMLDMFSGRIPRLVGSDTASEAVASTIMTLTRATENAGNPSVGADDEDDHRTVGTATVGEGVDDDATA